MDVKFFYFEHDYQRIIMRLSDAATVSLREDSIRLVFLWHLHWRDPLIDVYFSPLCFFQRLQRSAFVSPPKIVFISPAGGLLSLTSGVLS